MLYEIRDKYKYLCNVCLEKFNLSDLRDLKGNKIAVEDVAMGKVIVRHLACPNCSKEKLPDLPLHTGPGKLKNKKK